MRSPKLPWEAGLLVLFAVLALGFQLRLPTLLPRDEDYRALASQLQQRASPGDVVLLHPWWTERARLFTPKWLNVVGYLDSDGDALEDFSRIWVVSQPKLPYSGTGRFEEAFLRKRRRLEGPEQFGPLELSLYANGRHRSAAFRASDALADARVFLRFADGREVDCPRDDFGFRFRCPNTPPIAAGWHELFYSPHRCIAVLPPGGDTRLVVSFFDVRAANALRLEAGILWEHAARHDPGMTPLFVEVRDPRRLTPLTDLEIPLRQEGMQTRDLGSWAGGPLELTVRSARREHRDACIELRAGEGLPQ